MLRAKTGDCSCPSGSLLVQEGLGGIQEAKIAYQSHCHYQNSPWLRCIVLCWNSWIWGYLCNKKKAGLTSLFFYVSSYAASWDHLEHKEPDLVTVLLIVGGLAVQAAASCWACSWQLKLPWKEWLSSGLSGVIGSYYSCSASTTGSRALYLPNYLQALGGCGGWKEALQMVQIGRWALGSSKQWCPVPYTGPLRS